VAGQQDEEYGAAQPIVDAFRKITSFGLKTPKLQPPKKVDQSWRDDMVRKANESFQKPAAQKVPGGGTQKPTVRTGKKPAPKKKTAAKR
jgi:hypothetical protein